MNKVILGAMSALALMGASSAANATTYSPTGVNAWTFAGNVTASLAGAGPFVCPITIKATTTASSMSVTSISMGGICAIASLNNAPYAVTYTAAVGATSGPLNIAAVDATGPFGIHCGGALSGTWNNVAKTVTFTGATLPGLGGPSSGPCTFTGTLTATAVGGTPSIMN